MNLEIGNSFFIKTLSNPTQIVDPFAAYFLNWKSSERRKKIPVNNIFE